ncbi:MAG: radical SAM protein [Eubacteriales bacterium]|jgi:putative pyruvate formate lyase activating enzyme
MSDAKFDNTNVAISMGIPVGGCAGDNVAHYDEYKSCTLCPRRCRVNRTRGERGVCGMTDELTVARAALHMWEEPCISGERGSGTVFFTGCPLHCVYCQNAEISCEAAGAGKAVDTARLTAIFLELQEKGANNINLVTAGHFTPHVADAIKRAKSQGLTIPVVYNSSGYESYDTLRMLDGLIDVYLPDLKYNDPTVAAKHSGAPDYFDVASRAIDEMVHQTGTPVFADPGCQVDEGIMLRGMIVRHLVLPGHTDDSRRVISYLHERYGNDIYISIMNQYTPMPRVRDYEDLGRALFNYEYSEVVDFAVSIGVKNGFIQEGGTVAESFIPPFNCEGV